MGPGSDYVLGGPFYWFMVTLLLLGGMLSAFVVLDSVRRRMRDRDARSTISWWVYVVPQTAYFVLLMLVQTPLLPPVASAVLMLLTPLALIQQFAYLLRVVFPKPAAVDVATAAEEVVEAPEDGPTAEPPAS